jgi:hypothetical protein
MSVKGARGFSKTDCMGLNEFATLFSSSNSNGIGTAQIAIREFGWKSA